MYDVESERCKGSMRNCRLDLRTRDERRTAPFNGGGSSIIESYNSAVGIFCRLTAEYTDRCLFHARISCIRAVLYGNKNTI